MNKEERFPAQKPDPNNIIIGFDDYEIHGLFLNPVYIVKRSSTTINEEEEDKDIEDIIAGGMQQNYGNVSSINSYIFNSKLKEIKQFCEQQIKIYVERVILPKEELDCYITQSWLNITKPGGWHHQHCHPNSIISGVFYIATEEDDDIQFQNPLHWPEPKGFFQILSESKNWWNSKDWTIPAIKNQLLLFPSWLRHRVLPNKNARKDRISISFNTFVRGTFGNKIGKTELILK